MTLTAPAEAPTDTPDETPVVLQIIDPGRWIARTEEGRTKGPKPLVIYEHYDLLALALVESGGDPSTRRVVGVTDITFSDWPPMFVDPNDLVVRDEARHAAQCAVHGRIEDRW